jgi:membrane protein DedA with SNARE-associated domain
MTLRYVAITYNVPEEALVARLGLPAEVDPGTSLRSLATRQGRDPLGYVQEVQRAIAELRRTTPSLSTGDVPVSWLSALGDELVAAVLVYGYPALGLTLFAGAVGLPLPSGLSMVVAGSLAAQGHLNWWWASAVAVVASVLGDVTGYGLGRLAGRGLLARRGRWIGLTPVRLGQVEALFNRWGTLSVVLSRSLLSFLSSAVNLLAGAGRYPMRAFGPSAVVGRLTWTSAYLGLGYGLGTGFEAAADLLSSLSGLLASLAVCAGLGFFVYRRWRAPVRIGPPESR